MYQQDRSPILSRIAAALSLSQAMKQAKWAEEDRQRSIDNQRREQARQDVHDMITLNNMGAAPAYPKDVEGAMLDATGVANPRQRVSVAGKDYYLPSAQEQHQRDMAEFAEKLRTTQQVGAEDDVDIELPEPVAKLMGIPKIRVPQQLVPQIADHLDNIVNPPLHPYVKENDYGDVTAFGVNPRNMKITKGETQYGVGKTKTKAGAAASAKKTYTSRDLDTEAEAQVIGEAQKKYGDKLMIEPPEVGQAIASIKKEHLEFDDAAAREYLQRIGPRLPQYKGLFEGGRLRMDDYRKSAQFRKDMLTRRQQLKKKYEAEATGSAPANKAAAEQMLQGAINRVNQSNLPPPQKQAAIDELRRAHNARWGSK